MLDMKSTFREDECVFLLKDLTGVMGYTSLIDKETMISKGVNYSEMITEEVPVSQSVINIFLDMLSAKATDLAKYVGVVAENIYRKSSNKTVIVSLARAGSPVGVLIKRYLRYRYGLDIPHYSISIIRGKGIDKNALDYIVSNHPCGEITFVDGWTGKGSISKELIKAVIDYNKERETDICPDLAVLADPARIAAFAGTRVDACIPNACLNSTVSGLVSRTIHNTKYIGPDDFHGAIRYDNLINEDVTNVFLDDITAKFTDCSRMPMPERGQSCVDRIKQQLANEFPLSDIHKVKLSIGESSRALIRRVPYIMLVKNLSNPDLRFVLHLAKEKAVQVLEYDTLDYQCITLLK